MLISDYREKYAIIGATMITGWPSIWTRQLVLLPPGKSLYVRNDDQCTGSRPKSLLSSIPLGDRRTLFVNKHNELVVALVDGCLNDGITIEGGVMVSHLRDAILWPKGARLKAPDDRNDLLSPQHLGEDEPDVPGSWENRVRVPGGDPPLMLEGERAEPDGWNMRGTLWSVFHPHL